LSLERSIEEVTAVPLAVAASPAALRRVACGSSGVEGTCAWRQGFLRELGRSCHLHGSLAAQGWPPPPTPRPCVGASARAWERSPDATVVPSMAKENEAAAGGMTGSLSVWIVPVKPGERFSTTTRRREGGRLKVEPTSGTTPDASTSVSVSPQRCRIAELVEYAGGTYDCQRSESTVRRTVCVNARTYGSAGAWGG